MQAEIINSIVYKIGISLDKDPVDFYKQRTKLLFTSPARDKRGERVVFSIGLSEAYIKNISREIGIYQRAKELHLNFFPELLRFGETKDAKWLIYKFIVGNPLGNTYFFDPKTNFFNIIAFLESMQKLGNMLPKRIFRHSSKESYQKFIEIIVKKDQNLADKLENKIKKIANAIGDWQYDQFVHGDFHPQNILLTNDKIKVIDWEFAHYNLEPFDYSFVWIRCYDQRIRREIMSIIQGKKVDENQINFVFAINILRDYFELNQIIAGRNEFLNKQDINSAEIEAKILDLEQNLNFFVEKL